MHNLFKVLSEAELVPVSSFFFFSHALFVSPLVQLTLVAIVDSVCPRLD
jgi:hypothetical protein